MQLHENPKQWVILDNVPSTNSFLIERDFPSGTICFAHSQSKGRGQRERDWFSLKGGSFLFSGIISTKDSFPLSLLPLLSGVSVISALCAFQKNYLSLLAKSKAGVKRQKRVEGLQRARSFQIKWPNDVYLIEKKPLGKTLWGKLGGILIERQETKQEKAFDDRDDRNDPYCPPQSIANRIVIGIGINWSGKVETFKKAIEEASIVPAVLFPHHEEKTQKNDPKPESFLPYLIQDINKKLFGLMGGDLSFLEEARELSFLNGKSLLHQDGNEVYQVNGISDEGTLLVSKEGEIGNKELYSMEGWSIL